MMRHQSQRALSVWLFGLFAALAFFVAARPAAAAMAPPESLCPGNVCSDFLTIGGQRVNYWYTQHLDPSGQFRIRFALEGKYTSGNLISFIIFQMPSFVSHDKMANPDTLATALPEEDVSLDRTAYERRSSGGCPAGCTVDLVMSTQYAGLTPGQYAFNLYVVQNGASGGRNDIKFYVENGAPTNTNESVPWPLMDNMDVPCADKNSGTPIDNDLNFLANCRDPNCTGKQGHPTATWKKCEIPEQTCNDSFDNDGDNSTDCKDQDCNARQGFPEAVAPGFPPAVGTPAYCQWPNEGGLPNSLMGTTPCDDAFDNDADGKTDCADNHEWTVAGGDLVYDLYAPPFLHPNICWRQADYSCPISEKAICADKKNNDFDVPYHHEQYDSNPITGADCRDYDCAGDPACPSKENEQILDNGNRVQNDCQCFDGWDNDLDHLIDCADPDCLGAECATMPGRTCYDKEFDLGQKINLCGNLVNNDPAQPIDDDGDGTPNCQDSDCKQKFGNCGPCPKREDFTYAACANGRDDDVNGYTDCQDNKCRNNSDRSIGNLVNSAVCSAGENTPDKCADAFDNDANGKSDCSDSSCANIRRWPANGPLNVGDYFFCGAENTAAACSDGADNDGDGKRDCIDPDCWGVGTCKPLEPSRPACLTDGDRYDPIPPTLKYFAQVDPTVGTRTMKLVRAGSADVIHLEGSAAYASITIIVGDNTDPAKHYIYAGNVTCTLDGPNAADFGLTVVPESAVMIFNKNPGVPINGFNIDLKCVTPGTPDPTVYGYPIGISVLKTNGDAEYGDLYFSTKRVEGVAPALDEVEAEGARMVGADRVVKVPYGEPVRFRVAAHDLGVGTEISGVCRCSLSFDGDHTAAGLFDSATNECVVTPGGAYASFTYDREADPADGALARPPISLEMKAEDGVGNDSGWVPAGNVSINVTPTVVPGQELHIDEIKGRQTSYRVAPFFKGSADPADEFHFDVTFRTARNGHFNPVCEVYIKDRDGNVKYGGGRGPSGPTASFAPIVNLDNTIQCTGWLKAPDDFPVGVLNDPSHTYYMTVDVKDEDGDYVEAGNQALYICKDVPLSSDAGSQDTETENIDVCHWADFDNDGATEGFYTTLFSPTPKACDNCINLYNPDQQDDNLNGVGDGPEPYNCENDSRCVVDTDIVCQHDSFDFLPCVNGNTENCCTGNNCCPGGDKNDTSCCPSPSIKRDPLSLFPPPPPAIPPPDYRAPQACQSDWGLCSLTGQVCFMSNHDLDCPGTGICNADGKTECKEGYSPDPTTCGQCVGEEVCLQISYPWIEAKQGSVFSGKAIRAREEPPLKNATFCVTAKETIEYFYSDKCPKSDEEIAQDKTTTIERPQAKNAYSSSLGRIDIRGLLKGKYGEVIEYLSADEFLNELTTTIAHNGLQGKVYVVTGDLTIGSPGDPPLVISNAGTDELGSGTVVVKAGNLLFNRDVVYEKPFSARLNSPKQLASIGWVTLDQLDPENVTYGQRGNVFVQKDVENIVGDFMIGGQSGFSTVSGTDTDSPKPLTVSGLIVARQFHMSRNYKSKERGSEQVLYDGRAVINTPPGFADLAKSLPWFGKAPTVLP